MGYTTKIQKVERPTNQSFYVNLPSALAQSMNINKGEEFEWIVENKNLLILKRVNPVKPSKLKMGKN
jgi:antitoxin component of MazEF toxin-antitoxin module